MYQYQYQIKFEVWQGLSLLNLTKVAEKKCLSIPLNWRNLVALSGFCWAECESGVDGAAPGTEGRTRKFGGTRRIHQILA